MRTEDPGAGEHSPRRGRLLEAAITEKVIGAFFEVRRELKPGYLESVYRNALAIAIEDRGLGVEREVSLDVRFHGRVVGCFRADLIVGKRVLVEVKSADRLHPAHAAQVVNYLKTTNLAVGLLFNFGPYSEYRRVVWTSPR